MTVIKLILITCLMSICSHSFAQELVFVNQNGAFEEETEIYITLQFDHKPAIEVITKDAKINIGSYSFDSVATLIANGRFIRQYTNQYFPDQFRKLDTIVLYQTRMSCDMTSRIYLKRTLELDSVIQSEATFIRGFSIETPLDSTFTLNIYHARSLSKKDKQQIQAVKAAFCKEAGVDEKSIQLIDKKLPFSTGKFDFFNPGTVVTESFIKNQNTPWMKAKAEEYSLVLVVEIVWKK